MYIWSQDGVSGDGEMNGKRVEEFESEFADVKRKPLKEFCSQI